MTAKIKNYDSKCQNDDFTKVEIVPSRVFRVSGTDQGTTGGFAAILAMGTDLSIGERR